MSNTTSPGTGVATPKATSAAGVEYARGAVNPRTNAMLQSAGYGGDTMGLDLGWTNLTGFDGPSTGSPFGQGMLSGDLPSIEQASGGGFAVVQSAGNAIFFNSDDAPEFFSTDTLAADGSGGYLITQSDGTSVDFYGFGSGIPAAQQGQFESSTDADGNVTATTYNSDGQLATVGRTDGTTAVSYVYSYIASGVNAGLVSDVALERGPSGGTLSAVQHVAFTYYDGTDADGNLGQLEEETLEDASDNPLGTTYFRYYTSTGGVGYVGALEYQLDPQSYARLAATGVAPEDATDEELATYADQSYQYDSDRRVSETTVQGAGCSCSGSTGEGTYSYAYTDQHQRRRLQLVADRDRRDAARRQQEYRLHQRRRRGDAQRLRRRQRLGQRRPRRRALGDLYRYDDAGPRDPGGPALGRRHHQLSALNRTPRPTPTSSSTRTAPTPTSRPAPA